MKILYVITGLGVGGAEAITIDIANQMSDWGHDVTLLYLTGENAQIAHINPHIIVLGLGMSKRIDSLIKGVYRAVRIIKSLKPDIIHSHMVHANIFCRILRVFCKIPFLICTEHSMNIEGRMRMALYYVTDFLSDVNTNVSEEATRYFIQEKAFSPLKSIAVYNGVDLSRFVRNEDAGQNTRERYSIKDTDYLFINVGRLTQAKDQFNLITAFTYLREKYPNIKLIIVGDGKLRAALEKQICEKHIEDNVLLVGEQRNVVDYYSAANCFVLSSAWEGFGIVLVEAMACELPVIATNAGGCAEVVSNPNYVVPPKDSQALYLKMKQIYEMSQDERRILGLKNRELAYRFDINQVCRQWLKIYEGNNGCCHKNKNV